MPVVLAVRQEDNLPKPVRFAVGERIQAGSAECLRLEGIGKQAARWGQRFEGRTER